MSSGKMKGSKYRATDFIKAIPKSGGIISTIAARVGCDWETANRWCREYPTVKRAYENEKERVLDMAEGTIMKAIEGGDTQDAKWYLTKKGKQRGYGDRVEVAGDPDRPLTIRVVYEDANDTAG